MSFIQLPSKILVLICLLGQFGFYKTARSQPTDQKFRDLFTTAGYATAFGAALGAAALSFKERPENHLRYVAIGASMGFIGGSIMGTYVVFAPAMVADQNRLPGLYEGEARDTKFVITPQFSQKSSRIDKIQGSWVIADF